MVLSAGYAPNWEFESDETAAILACLKAIQGRCTTVRRFHHFQASQAWLSNKASKDRVYGLRASAQFDAVNSPSRPTGLSRHARARCYRARRVGYGRKGRHR